MTPLPTLVIGIVSCGRPGILRETVQELRKQSYPASRIIVCTPRASDADGLAEADGLTILRGPIGACHQRNVILDHAGDNDVIVFFDDDFLPDRNYLKVCAEVFGASPGILAATGRVLADGAKGPGFSMEEARQMLDNPRINDNPAQSSVEDAWSSYGCNMAFRIPAVQRHGVRFDERLPLYAWYEDIDFSRRLGRHGRVVRMNAAKGIHLASKTGKTPGRRLGYSQVANPIYLSRKGTFPWDHTLRSVGRNITMNLMRSLWPEPYVDRRGRLLGNGLALMDLLRGRIAPERILTL
ncbi:glycosyl transferase family 2 [Gluconacetobacter diazotrophicus PA1 5]|uniref:Glycosyltransferase family 2 protein n=2 Tax=Gluconacetobacter diazotrophicus TaxID=33996 RepID=A0A7W4FDJ6_GLUDI|nr:glycosyltransferase [Gluconacetobacter diazotrophicus]ACI50531.1 glycosyl transferase family 2 [Gluconacetobacter diazotrophicus PA1 5]MBB2155724.1 glycosyltransferase family 2 protein [Gluconacetobacter diazotrophicus]TWB09363.1 GT2 family glycosyltransferase [Gluconacetobacter diazotrophicus]CAP56440.1 putative glycosyl transferase [Gluconacetobacter diazotrophicus PA1 5]